MLSVGHCGVARLQMKVGHMDGMHCFIDSTSILVKIKPVSLYNCRTVYECNATEDHSKFIFFFNNLAEAPTCGVGMPLVSLLKCCFHNNHCNDSNTSNKFHSLTEFTSMIKKLSTIIFLCSAFYEQLQLYYFST